MNDLDLERYRKAKEQELVQFQKLIQLLNGVRRFPTSVFEASGPEIVIGDTSELMEDERKQMREVLEAFKPWRKGPFRIFGNVIDAEWRSDWKWERIRPYAPDLKGKVIADIGANNAYYMFRMSTQEPKKVIGFEPYLKHKIFFDFIQSFVRRPELEMSTLGVEHMDSFPKTFDVVFCLGILYHHTDPVGLLRKIHKSLRKRGKLIIDCQGISHEEPIALTPETTYAGSTGMWFLPSLSCLKHWLLRSSFRHIHCFYQEELSTEEQRRTEWAPDPSLEEFLTPTHPRRTVEGYPRPWRFYLSATK